MALDYVEKDPSANLTYTFDWTEWLGADTITAVAWTVPAGITKEADSSNTKTATVRLSGGTARTAYTVVCRITTAAGDADERSLVVNVRER